MPQEALLGNVSRGLVEKSDKTFELCGRYKHNELWNLNSTTFLSVLLLMLPAVSN